MTPPARTPTATSIFHFTRQAYVVPLLGKQILGRHSRTVYRLRMRRRLGAAVALGLLVLLGACTEQGDLPPEQTGSGIETPAEEELSPEPGEELPPVVVPEDQRFALDDVVTFDDGLVVQVEYTEPDKAKSADKGAEATNGEIVIVTIRFENGADEEFAAEDVLFSATYGDNNTVAQPIVAADDSLMDGFDGPIAPDTEEVTTLGFAVPASETGKVTYIVDPQDDFHDPFSFTGEVKPQGE